MNQPVMVDVDVITLDDLLLPPHTESVTPAWRAALPLPLGPDTLAVLKVDAEGYDAAVMHGARKALAAAPHALLLVEFEPIDLVAVAGCHPGKLWRYLQASGKNLLVDAYSIRALSPACTQTNAQLLDDLDTWSAAALANTAGEDMTWEREGVPTELLVVSASSSMAERLLLVGETLVNNTHQKVWGPLEEGGGCGRVQQRGLR